MSLATSRNRKNQETRQAKPEHVLEVEVYHLLRERGLWLATAESCTGGLVGHLITNVPGSSSVYAGGVVAYAYEVKMGMLGVPAGLLAQYGAVSRETAIAMAKGVREAMPHEFERSKLVAISVTGIAGPGGETPEKPVGLTWISIQAEGFSGAWRFVWDGDRAENKLFSAQEALRLLIEYLRGSPRPGG